MLIANAVAIGDDNNCEPESRSVKFHRLRLRPKLPTPTPQPCLWLYIQIIHGELLQCTLQSHALQCIVSSKHCGYQYRITVYLADCIYLNMD